jgi:hypothetical protein
MEHGVIADCRPINDRHWRSIENRKVGQGKASRGKILRRMNIVLPDTPNLYRQSDKSDV